MLAISIAVAFHAYVATLQVEPILSDPSTMPVAGSLVIGTTGVVVDVPTDTHEYLDTSDLAPEARGDEADPAVRMNERYPQRALPLILQLSAQAASGSEH